VFFNEIPLNNYGNQRITWSFEQNKQLQRLVVGSESKTKSSSFGLMNLE